MAVFLTVVGVSVVVLAIVFCAMLALNKAVDSVDH